VIKKLGHGFWGGQGLLNHHTRVNAHMSLSCRNWLQGQGSLAEARSQPRSTRPVPPMPLSHRREQGWGYSSLGRAIGSRTIGCGVTSMAAGPASRSHANRSAKGLSSGIARSRGCSGHGQAETSGLVAGGGGREVDAQEPLAILLRQQAAGDSGE
jgi:hypothetical protein